MSSPLSSKAIAGLEDGNNKFMKILRIFIFLLLFTKTLAQNSLRFYGSGVSAPDQDRVKIMIDNPANGNPGPPADIGASDFTIEFWMKAQASDNTSPGVSCGANINWIYGNIILDRDRYNQDRKFGISLAGGYVVFGISGDGSGEQTLCGSSNVLDNAWHHIALQRRRSDGYLWMYIDGIPEGEVDGPDGDISYPDDGTPCGSCCGGANCNNSDPYLVIGAEKHDAGAQFPSYNGFLDELRLSTVLRYSATFIPSSSPFNSDEQTAALYHFDEGAGSILTDFSVAPGGPSPGNIYFGGTPEGPVWSLDTPFNCIAEINSWEGPGTGDWHEASANWSLSRIPGACDLVRIPRGVAISISGSNKGSGKALEVTLGSVFEIDLGAEIEIGLN